MSVSLAVSAGIFCLIALRQWLPGWLKIWHIMSLGAVILIAAGEIALRDAAAAVDWNVILYLFGVFSIGAALSRNGLSQRLAARLARIPNANASFAAFMVSAAVVAAVVTNDAAAIIGTPIAFALASRAAIDPKRHLIGLCAAVTIGSMVTPVGNPQNLLILASREVPVPVVTFFLWLFVPAAVSLAFAAWWLRRSASQGNAVHGTLAREETKVAGRLWPSYASVAVLAILVLGDSVVTSINADAAIPFGVVGLLACLPVYLFDQGRSKIARDIDWPTLIFFVAMFVVTGALIGSGALQAILGNMQKHLNEPLVTAAVAFVGSQAFSNVPVVDMYLKLLDTSSVANLMMLSAASTLAGNVFVISAASNVIVVQQAERRGYAPFTFGEFARAAAPIGACSLVISVLWILTLAALS